MHPGCPMGENERPEGPQIDLSIFLVLAIQVLWDPILTCKYVALFLQVEFGRSGFIMGISPLLINKIIHRWMEIQKPFEIWDFPMDF